MINVQPLLQKIVKTFPEMTWKSYEYIDSGWDHSVIILDKAWVFRFPHEPDYAEHLRNETKILTQIRSAVAVTIPEYSLITPDGSFAGYKIISGEPLTPSMLAAFTATDRASLVQQLAGFLSTLHTLSPQQLNYELVPPSDMADYHADLTHQVPIYLRNTMTVADFESVEGILAETKPLLTSEHPKVFLHGDLYHSHLLWDAPSSRLGVIDFSDMNIGDPAFDFAELYEYGIDFVEEVYDAYTGPKDDNFLQRAWKYQKLVGVYMLVDHFLNHKTSFAIARETFDRTQAQAFY
jgi:aminoglycoside phosphotransferase (APT) family kinase protein